MLSNEFELFNRYASIAICYICSYFFQNRGVYVTFYVVYCIIHGVVCAGGVCHCVYDTVHFLGNG